MKKILSFFAVLLMAMTASATIRNITPTHCFEGDRADGYTLYVEITRGAQAGDTIVMADGIYVEPLTIAVANDLVVMAAEGANPVVQMSGYFDLSASIKFYGITFDHTAVTTNSYLTYFRTTDCHHVVLEGCEVTGFRETCIMSWEAYHLDSIILNNCYFHNIIKSVIYVTSNQCDKVVVTNSTFANIHTSPSPIDWSASVIDVRNDGSVAANQIVRVDHCTFYDCKTLNTDHAPVLVKKSTDVIVSNCIFAWSEMYDKRATYLYGGNVNNCITYNTNKDTGTWGHHSGPQFSDCSMADPLFVDAANGDYTLSLGEGGNNSPALRAGVNGECLGDPRWWPTFNVRGTMNGWSATDDQMEWAEANHIYYKQIDLAAGSYEFKINHGAWLADWGPTNIAGGLGDVALSDVNGNIGMTTDGRPIIVYFDLAHNVVWVDYLYPKVELLGNFTNWGTNPLVMLNDINNEYCVAQAEFDNPGLYEYRIRINDAANWKGNAGVMDRANCTGWDMDANHNCGIKIDIPGLYEFKYDFASEQMSVTYAESFTRVNNDEHYQTLCAPFNASITNATVYEVTAASAGGVTINAIDPAMLVAGKSYIVKPTADMVITKVGDGVVSDPIFPMSQGTGLYGVLSESYTYVYNDEPTWKNIFILQDDDMFHQVIADGSATITSTRAYLHIAGDELVPNPGAPGIRIIENATNIQNIEGNETAVKFIENGQLFIKKNGVVYDAVGTVVK